MPEPSALLGLLAGCALLAWLERCRRKSAVSHT
jgi:hypothetical protein